MTAEELANELLLIAMTLNTGPGQLTEAAALIRSQAAEIERRGAGGGEWVRVPRVWTDEMEAAADDAFHEEMQTQTKRSKELYGKPAYASGPFMERMWKAAIAAAPQPPEQPVEMPVLTASSNPVVVLRRTLEEARDLLTERVYGNPTLSPAHNARLAVEFAIKFLDEAQPPEQAGMEEGWRDISTAPKDGTRMLLHYTHAREDADQCFTGNWCDTGTREMGAFWENDCGNMMDATHWRPLPSPPMVEESR